MDRGSFDKILKEQNKKIFNYLLKMLRNREDAEDILQETFISFYQKMESVSEEAHLAYLYRTAHNKALNHIKKQKKQKNSITVQAEMEYFPDQKKSEENDDKNLHTLQKAFFSLSEKDATLLEMQFYQKMSYKDIAAALEISERAVDSRLVRAKRKMKKIISQETKRIEVIKSRGEKNE